MNGENPNYDRGDKDDGDLIRTDFDYVNEGMLNWLNNKPKQAEQFLKGKIDHTPVLAAYSFVLCMVCYGMACVWVICFILLFVSHINVKYLTNSIM